MTVISDGVNIREKTFKSFHKNKTKFLLFSSFPYFKMKFSLTKMKNKSTSSERKSDNTGPNTNRSCLLRGATRTESEPKLSDLGWSAPATATSVLKSTKPETILNGLPPFLSWPNRIVCFVMQLICYELFYFILFDFIPFNLPGLFLSLKPNNFRLMIQTKRD